MADNDKDVLRNLKAADPNSVSVEHVPHNISSQNRLESLEQIALQGTLAQVQALVARGASIKDGRPLHLACQNENRNEAYAIAEFLIEAGCDVNQMDEENDRRNIGRPLHWAAQMEHADHLIELLLKHGANPDGRSAQNYTPLSLAQVWVSDTTRRAELLQNYTSVAPWGPWHALAYRNNGYLPMSPSSGSMAEYKKAADVDQPGGVGYSFGLSLEQ